jgi:hypothetical protein
MLSDVQRFKAACAVTGQPVPGGASEEQLEAFEEKHGVQLPADMRAFYGHMKGALDHESIFGFWSLNEIRRTTANNESNWFFFADHSVSVFEYAIKMSANGVGPNDVYCPELERTVAASFSDFLRRCLDDPASLW